MRRREIYAMAIVWTALMATALQLGAIAMPWAICLAVAYLWFWIGRLSCRPAGESCPDDSPAPPRWGRAGGRTR